jgi:hypothetical protein
MAVLMYCRSLLTIRLSTDHAEEIPSFDHFEALSCLLFQYQTNLKQALFENPRMTQPALGFIM